MVAAVLTAVAAVTKSDFQKSKQKRLVIEEPFFFIS
jgi:hypothetical protein